MKVTVITRLERDSFNSDPGFIEFQLGEGVVVIRMTGPDRTLVMSADEFVRVAHILKAKNQLADILGVQHD